MKHYLLLLLLLAAPVFAAEEPAAETPPSDDAIEPEVTIVHKKEQTIEEYRVHGQLYMVKITPKKGVPYYLVDSDGDGDLETRRNDLVPASAIPAWVILRW